MALTSQNCAPAAPLGKADHLIGAKKTPHVIQPSSIQLRFTTSLQRVVSNFLLFNLLTCLVHAEIMFVLSEPPPRCLKR
jgi:hypothetical protein